MVGSEGIKLVSNGENGRRTETQSGISIRRIVSDLEGLPSFHFLAAIPKYPLVFFVILHGLDFVVQVADTMTTVETDCMHRCIASRTKRWRLTTRVDSIDSSTPDMTNVRRMHGTIDFGG